MRPKTATILGAMIGGVLCMVITLAPVKSSYEQAKQYFDRNRTSAPHLISAPAFLFLARTSDAFDLPIRIAMITASIFVGALFGFLFAYLEIGVLFGFLFKILFYKIPIQRLQEETLLSGIIRWSIVFAVVGGFVGVFLSAEYDEIVLFGGTSGVLGGLLKWLSFRLKEKVTQSSGAKTLLSGIIGIIGWSIGLAVVGGLVGVFLSAGYDPFFAIVLFGGTSGVLGGLLKWLSFRLKKG